VSGNPPRGTVHLSKVLGERWDHEKESEEPLKPQIIPKHHGKS